MKKRVNQTGCQCGQVQRRTFLADIGMGFTGLALASMLARDGGARASDGPWQPPSGKPHHPPRAKSVIWVFLSGGYSQMETFDPKPALNKYAGKTFQETPFENPLESPLPDKRSRSVIEMVREKYSTIFPMQVGYGKHGENGIEVTDWWPHPGAQTAFMASEADECLFGGAAGPGCRAGRRRAG